MARARPSHASPRMPCTRDPRLRVRTPSEARARTRRTLRLTPPDAEHGASVSGGVRPPSTADTPTVTTTSSRRSDGRSARRHRQLHQRRQGQHRQRRNQLRQRRRQNTAGTSKGADRTFNRIRPSQPAWDQAMTLTIASTNFDQHQSSLDRQRLREIRLRRMANAAQTRSTHGKTPAHIAIAQRCPQWDCARG